MVEDQRGRRMTGEDNEPSSSHNTSGDGARSETVTTEAQPDSTSEATQPSPSDRTFAFVIAGSVSEDVVVQAKLQAIVQQIHSLTGDASIELVEICSLTGDASIELVEALDKTFDVVERTSSTTRKSTDPELKAQLIQEIKTQDHHGRYLSDTDLRGADFSRADLRGVDLRGADLRGADLSNADLREANITKAKFINVTGIPSWHRLQLGMRGAIFEDFPRK